MITKTFIGAHSLSFCAGLSGKVRYLSSSISRLQQTSPAPLPVGSSAAEAVPADIMPATTTSAGETASDILMKIGDLKANGLCNWTPPGLIERLLEFTHVSIGLPWWMTICASAVAVRTLLLPVYISTQRKSMILKKITPQISAISDEYKKEQDRDKKIELMQKMQAIYAENNVSPLFAFKNAMISAPITISFFLALRDISELKLPALATGGAAWFTNLTVPDPYYVLPLSAAGCFLYVVENGLETGGKVQSAATVNFFRLMAVASVPLMAQFPTALSLYWLTNSAISIGIASAMKKNSVRKFLNIPLLDSSNAETSNVPEQSGDFIQIVKDSMNAAKVQNPPYQTKKKSKKARKKAY